MLKKKTILYAILFFELSLFGFFLNFQNAEAAETVPVYRFYSKKYKSHLYTASESEKANIIANWPSDIWAYQKIEFSAYDGPEEGLIPVYRFWSKKYRTLYYSISETEKNNIIANWPIDVWEYQGIKFYVNPSEQEGLTPVYRFWSSKYKSTYFTTSPGQKNCMVDSYADDVWKYTGVVWWVPIENADLSETVGFCGGNLGPDISVGLWNTTRSGSQSTPFRIRANKAYKITDSNGDIVAEIPADTNTYISYDANDKLSITGPVAKTVVGSFVTFDSADGKNSNMIFDVNTPVAGLDQYRGKFRFKFTKYDDDGDGTIEDSERQIWAINILPMEQYVWGMGKITGTGAMEYNKVMTTSFRTYGYYKLHHSTAYLNRGFIVNATPGNQLYYGYEWETGHPRIKEGAKATYGKIVTHPQSAFYGDVAITPYSSWTDGRTRSFQERWGSTSYPWCKSVSDPYGEHPTMSTTELEAAGNHMVGLSAHGALNLATDHGWDWQRILKYYYTGINIKTIY